jgi:hypothetical protein
VLAMRQISIAPGVGAFALGSNYLPR